MLRINAAVVGLGLLIAASGSSWSIPVSQVDQVAVSGPYYRNDQVTLNLIGPFLASVTYTVTPDDEVGYNAYNVAKHWSEAIALDPLIGSLLTVDFTSPADAAFPDILYFTLTGKNPGEAFQASVQALEACNCDFNETSPITAVITTLTSAAADSFPVPEPSGALILVVSLALLSSLRRRRRIWIP